MFRSGWNLENGREETFGSLSSRVGMERIFRENRKVVSSREGTRSVILMVFVVVVIVICKYPKKDTRSSRRFLKYT